MAARDHSNSRLKYTGLSTLAAAQHWPFDAAGITGTDILVADDAVIDVLAEAAARGQIKVLSPDTLTPDHVAAADRVFVLLLDGELACVRRLKHQFPEVTIISVTYGEHGCSVDLTSLAAQGADVTAVVSSPCSGFGYLQDLIEANSLADTVITMTPAEIVWAKCQQDFNMARWLAAKLQGLQGHVILDLELTLVDHLRGQGLLRQKKFKFFLTAAEARLIFMTRRNRADQIALVQIEGLRSSGDSDNSGEPAEPDAEALLPSVLEITAVEARFEKLFGLLPYFRTVTFEELTGNPIDVVKMLTAFFERPTLRKISVTNPAAEMLQADWKDSFRVKYKAAVIEFLGLSKNEFGSYQTKTEQHQAARRG